MGRIITAVLAIAAMSGIAYWSLYRPTKDAVIEKEATSAPKRTLDNVRAKAKDIERQQDEHVADVEHRMATEAGANGPAEAP